MALLFITEFHELTVAKHQIAQVPSTASIQAEQVLDIDDISVQSEPFNQRTKFIMVSCDLACFLAFGDDPVALANVHRLPANATRYYGVIGGQKIAVIGTMTISTLDFSVPENSMYLPLLGGFGG